MKLADTVTGVQDGKYSPPVAPRKRSKVKSGLEYWRVTESKRKPFKAIKSGERVVYLYDALNIVNKEFSKTDQPQLNENQQIVLEWLKEEQTKNPELTIFGTLSVLFDESENRFMNLDVIDALNNLSNPQQAGVFQAFSQWALEQEEE